METKTSAPKTEPASPVGKTIGGNFDPLSGDNPRGEVAGCPTGLGNIDQANQAQRPGGGGAPGTGEAEGGIPYSPGEGVNEEQAEGRDK